MMFQRACEEAKPSVSHASCSAPSNVRAGSMRSLQDDVTELDRRHHEDGREAAGQQRAEDDVPVARAERARGLDVFPVPQRKDLTAGDAGEDHPVRDRDHDDDVPQALPEHRGEQDREQDRREGELHVGDPH